MVVSIGARLDAEGVDARWIFEANGQLERMDARARLAWIFSHVPGPYAITTSFGIQAAATLDLVVSQRPNIPVIFIDTGYLFPETYLFADELVERLGLNLRVYRSTLSPAWQEARYGRLWEQGLAGIERYNHMNKVQPLQQALGELGVKTWIAGLRREQSDSRKSIPVLGTQDGRFKVCPIADWLDNDVELYLRERGLPYHLLKHRGYASVGDTHTTSPLLPGMREQDTRFFGLKRECGIHNSGG